MGPIESYRSGQCYMPPSAGDTVGGLESPPHCRDEQAHTASVCHTRWVCGPLQAWTHTGPPTQALNKYWILLNKLRALFYP